ncbi:putative HSP40/DnaJ peptide-binding protein [Hibiscus syriacus]|uniref:HSP40/DnaJ peptide-binding protein n=1 Tax=Hibiscus syriacus TaxID=106335 RepID=A0A6A2ZL02_HIBSY|nr:putative HSP40/DnaJ peptide-binding protein [Hibiscus syriacus]
MFVVRDISVVELIISSCTADNSAGLWSQDESESTVVIILIQKLRGKLALKFWKTDEFIEKQAESSSNGETSKTIDDAVLKIKKEETRNSFYLSAKQTFKAAFVHFSKKWHRRLSCLATWHSDLWKFPEANITGLHFNLDVPNVRIFHLDRINLYAVYWLERRSKAFEPTYLYTMEKSCLKLRMLLLQGYFLLPEAAKSIHNIRYLYNFQTKEFYNLSYAQELPDGSARVGDYLVTKCGVLMMSLFVFFTTTMSVSFTLRETQTRMLKFTVQLQHHARHRLPTFQLIFVHVIESLVFVPIMIGILFFLFEFYDDQLLAFMVLILVWLCELFILISVRTPISMKFFPRFFLLYFLVFHIYFFCYAYGFSYLALSTTAAFMQHLILYFWNRFEVPALQRFMQNRRSQFQQHPDFHITSSTILASTLHITRLNTRNPGVVRPDPNSVPGLRPGSDQEVPANGVGEAAGPRRQSEMKTVQGGNPMQIPEQPELQQAEAGPNPGTLSSFSSLLLWILGGASSEGLNSFLSMFRDVREQGQVYTDSPHENRATQNVQ